MIDSSTIEEIKNQINIVDIISKFIKLKKKGADYESLCPFHDEKTPSFSVSASKGIFKCFGCGKSGDAIQFVIEHENKPYIEAIKYLAGVLNIPIDENLSKGYEKPVARLQHVSDKTLAFFEGRGISNNTLLRLKVTEAKEFMPQLKAEYPCICFNYYRDEELINIKFRGPKKSFKLAKNAELIFYNLDSIKGEKWAVCVEGELDCLSLHESNIYNVVSVPNGAGTGNLRLDYLDNCWQSFMNLEKVILFTDNDEPGRRLKDELARRIGKEKCWVVEYPEGCKDANDVLIKHGKEFLKSLVDNAKEWPLDGVLSVDDFGEEILDWYDNGYPKGCETKITGLDELITFVPRQLTLITGIPGHGKDEFLNNMMVGLNQVNNWKFAVTGFEEQAQITTTKVIEKYFSKSFAFRKNQEHRLTREQVERGLLFVHDNFFFLNIEHIDVTIEGILKKNEELVKRKGINAIVINPWNCLEHNMEGGLNETQYTSKILTKIINFVTKYDVHCFLVAHPTKVKKDPNGKFEVPTPYHISGSAHFFNKTHNSMCVYRNYDTDITDVYVQKVKHSWLGQIGRSSYKFDTMTREYNFLDTSVTKVTSWKPVDLGNKSTENQSLFD